MTVIDARKDLDTLTMTFTARFDAPVERVWQIWEDPRQLERWWGPPTYPATFVEHDLSRGGRATYFMTGPEGDTHYGWWRVLLVEPPHRLELEDGFAFEDGRPNPELPTTTMRMQLAPDGDATVMTLTSTISSREAMEQLLEMGMVEGMTEALGQIDALLSAGSRTG